MTSDQISVLVDRILVKLEETKRYKTVSRADLNAMLDQEKLKDVLGCDADTSCLVEIGGAAGSDFLLTGTVTFEADKYLINSEYRVDGGSWHAYVDKKLNVNPVTPGEHKVEVRCNGYMSTTERPTAATVYFNGINKGTTPLELKRIGAKAHRIRLSKSLYHDRTETVLVHPGEGFAETYDLRPAFGTLNVTADKTDANVLIDGELVGPVPFSKTARPESA